MSSQMLQLKNDVLLDQLLERSVFVRRRLSIANNAQRGIAVPQPGLHYRQKRYFLGMKQSDHGAAIGVSTNHHLADLKLHDGVLNDGRYAACITIGGDEIP